MDTAVLGLSCRFPGDADGVEKFWEFLCEKRTSVSETTSRWNMDAFHSPRRRINTSITRRAHYLKQDIAAWDAKFFDISKAEAEAIDPQQRIFLEVVYEALENAGLPMEGVAGTRTGVFVGSFTNDYSELIHRDPEAAPSAIFTGTNSTSTSNRVSWFFDFKGPSITLNTACSSSLVALHLACQSLQTGDSDTAIVGGVNLLLNPDIFLQLSNQGFLAHDGQCKSFDATGDGYGRGDGFAAIVLRRADDAIKLRDPIRAVIRGTGCNQDGKTRGFTLPSANAQAELTKETYEKAGLQYNDTLFVEAHGTGTQAGDAEETFGLAQTLASKRSPLQPLLIGSVKANIGHLEGCAGLAGFIKAVLILERGIIPPTYGIKTFNPKIKWSEWNLEVPTEVMSWPGDGLRRISTQGFGYGGTNAHAIIDDTSSFLTSKGIREMDNPQSAQSDILNSRIFVINAQDRPGLTRIGRALARHISRLSNTAFWSKNEEQIYLQDLAYTLSMRRSKLQWSTAVVASSSSDLCQKLDKIQSSSGSRRLSRPVRVGYVLTGQGAQWARMGQELMGFDPYRESVRESDTYLRKTLGCHWSAEQELAKNANISLIHEAEYSQTLCTVLQVALVDLLSSWGIQPSAVVGHSSGEIAAAYCAGIITRENAWKIAYFRGLHCAHIGKSNSRLRGAMMVVNAAPADLANIALSTTRGNVFLACYNSPSSITYAGDEAAISELLATLQAKGVNAQKLHVDRAYHSPHMQVISHDYMRSIEDIDSFMQSSLCTFFSTTNGEATDWTAVGPIFWVRNLTTPVRFSDAITRMFTATAPRSQDVQSPIDVLVEIGPSDALRGAVGQTLQAKDIKQVEYIATLKRNSECVHSMLQCAGTLLQIGVPVNMERLNRFRPEYFKPLIDLPAYPWNHSQSFWWESRLDREFRSREHGHKALLGAPHPSFNEGEYIWRGFIRTNDEPWIRDHVIQGEVLFPAAGFLSMAIEATLQQADEMTAIKRLCLWNVMISAALLIPVNVDPEIVVVLRPRSDRDDSKLGKPWEFTISSSLNSEPLRKNCHGLVGIESNSSDNPFGSNSTDASTVVVSLRPQTGDTNTSKKSSKEFYDSLAETGLRYGTEFAKLTDIEHSPGWSAAKLHIANPGSQIGTTQPSRQHLIHPATLDASFHLAFAALMDHSSILQKVMVPIRIEAVSIASTIDFEIGSSLLAYAHAVRQGKGEAVVDITALDKQMEKVQLEVKGLCLAEVPNTMNTNLLNKQPDETAMCYALEWRPVLQAMSPNKVQTHFEKRLRVRESHAIEGIIRTIADLITEYIYLLQHDTTTRDPLSLLEIDMNLPESEGPLIVPQSPDFSQFSRFCQYQAIFSDENRLNQMKATSDTINADYANILGKNTSLIQERHHNMIIVVNMGRLSKTQAEIVTKKVVDLLASEGRIVLVDRSDHSSLATALELRGFSVETKFTFGSDETSRMNFVCVKRPKKKTSIESDIVILEAAHPTSKAKEIASNILNTLQKHNIPVHRERWPISPTALLGKACLSLIELDGPLLKNINMSDFDHLKDVLLSAVDLTWVGALQNPSASLISGLARTIHNEVTNARCRSLLLDEESMDLAGAIVHDTISSTSKDVELRAVRGTLHSSRIEPDLTLNDRVLESANGYTPALDPEGAYILVGGLGGIGRSLALMLIEMGARKLCFISRSGAATESNKAFMGKLQSLNVSAVAYSCNIGELAEVEESVRKCHSLLGNIQGLIQCAMSLQDALFTNMTHAQWNESLRPKVHGTQNLHDALPSNLSFFVMLSSFAGIFGNRGQANYAAGCNYQDAFAHMRREQGQRAVSVDLGIVRDVGVLAETGGDNKLKSWEEHFGIRERDLHKLLRAVIESELGLGGMEPMAAQIVTGFGTAADFQRVGLEVPYYFSEPRFSLLAATKSDQTTHPRANDAESTFSIRNDVSISTATSVQSAAETVAEAITHWLAARLQTSVTEIDQSRPVHSYGVDSLLAIEVTQWLFQTFRSSMTVFELLSAIPITALARSIVEKSADLPVSLR